MRWQEQPFPCCNMFPLERDNTTPYESYGDFLECLKMTDFSGTGIGASNLYYTFFRELVNATIRLKDYSEGY